MAHAVNPGNTHRLANPAFASRFPGATVSPNMSPNMGPDQAPISGASAVSGWLHYAAPTKVDPLAELREAVAVEDWNRNFAEGKTQCNANANWCASPDRCNMLQSLCRMRGSIRVLEIGSFVGAAALALAEELPEEGEVVSLEFDAFFAEFGQHYRKKSAVGAKIKTIAGPAMESLATLAEEIKDQKRQPFDFVVIDADKSNMQGYFDFIWANAMLSSRPVVCVDMTPFKGQVPLRYARFGMQDQVDTQSGEEQIDEFRQRVKTCQDYIVHEYGGMLVVQHAS